MSGPIRSKQHVSESVAVRAIERCLPKHWISRRVTDRDYGLPPKALHTLGLDSEHLTRKLVGILVRLHDLNDAVHSEYGFCQTRS
jgi:hypothetical protein